MSMSRISTIECLLARASSSSENARHLSNQIHMVVRCQTTIFLAKASDRDDAMRAGDLPRSSRSNVSAFLRAICLLVVVAVSVAGAAQQLSSQPEPGHLTAGFHHQLHSDVSGSGPDAGCAPAATCWAVPSHAGGHGAMALAASCFGRPASDQFPPTLFTAIPEQPPRVSS